MTKVISPTRIAVRLADDDLNPHDVNIPANTAVDVDPKLVRGLVALGASVVEEPAPEPEPVAVETPTSTETAPTETTGTSTQTETSNDTSGEEKAEQG